MSSIRPHAAEKAIELTVRSEPNEPVSGDADRLDQVFSNLLSNAVKFTPKGGRIHCVVSQSGQQVEVRVTDSGEGIRAEMLGTIFQRFRQVDGSRTRRHGGLGLGLAIVRHLVEAHGGRVWATSPGEGRGSTFTVLLPIASAQLGMHGVSRPDASPIAWGDGSYPLSGVRALVVDDDRSARELLERLLMDDGAIVHTAGSAAEALSIFAGWRPDVFLIDIAMPEVDGYQLLQRLRQEPDGASIPAIAVTGYARPGDRDEALSSGFQAHLAKPFEAALAVQLTAQFARRPARATP
jgi:CheY-like chemotaxis protein